MPFFGSLRKGSSCSGPMGKASMVGFTLLSRSYYYLRRRSGDSHDGGWRWGAPLGRVAWSRLDPRTGSGTVLIGSKPLSTLNAQPR
jgi:hypothetical protein